MRATAAGARPPAPRVSARAAAARLAERLRPVRIAGGAAQQLLRPPRAGAAAVVLAYHDVVDGPAEGLAVSARQLESHVRLLRRLGLRIVALDELLACWEQARPPRPSRPGAPTGAAVGGRSAPADASLALAAITFDDALVGVSRVGLDVLDALDAPATIFVVSGVSGVAPSFWPGAARTMDRTELIDAAGRRGVSLGSHTVTHCSLPSVALPVARRELRDSRAALEDLTGRAVTTLAYPYGHHDRGVREEAAEAGYRHGFTFLNGRLLGAEDPFRLPRLTMTAATPRWKVGAQLARPAGSWPDHQADVVREGGPA